MKNVTRVMTALALASTASASRPAEAAPKEDMNIYAACIVKRAPAAARQLLDTAVESAEEAALAGRLVNRYEKCLDDTQLVSVETGALRGGVAEALIRDDSERLNAVRALEPGQATPAVRASGRALLAGIADCLVAANPKMALRLIEARRRSHAEREAVQGFGAGLKTCAPDGTAYRLSIADTRDHVADALYRRAQAARTGS